MVSKLILRLLRSLKSKIHFLFGSYRQPTIRKCIRGKRSVPLAYYVAKEVYRWHKYANVANKRIKKKYHIQIKTHKTPTHPQKTHILYHRSKPKPTHYKTHPHGTITKIEKEGINERTHHHDATRKTK